MSTILKSSLLPTSTHYTSDQVAPTGCCFNFFKHSHQVTRNTEIPLKRNRSETKVKKIDLVIAKRGQTQEKLIRNAVKDALQVKPNSQSDIKSYEHNTCQSSLTSKLTTQKNSLKNSRIKLCQETKHHNRAKQQKYDRLIQMNTCATQRQMGINFNHTRVNSSNIQMLSEITLVEEQFISNDSNTFKALQMLQQLGEDRLKQPVINVQRYATECPQLRKASAMPETVNPLQRLIEKKKNYKPENVKQRLVL